MPVAHIREAIRKHVSVAMILEAQTKIKVGGVWVGRAGRGVGLRLGLGGCGDTKQQRLALADLYEASRRYPSGGER